VVVTLRSAIVELSELPLGLSDTTSIRQAIDVYRGELQWINSTKPPSTLVSDANAGGW
jgi:pyruvate dehydrogenase kinase 2/3/4